MKELAGDKVREIIRDEFDERMSMAVVLYILDHGFEEIKDYTEEDILKVTGNGLMTDVFAQALIRSAVRICKECSPIDDFLPYIINQLYVPKAKTHSVELYKEEIPEYLWDKIMDEFELDYEEEPDAIEMIELNANLLGFYPEQ